MIGCYLSDIPKQKRPERVFTGDAVNGSKNLGKGDQLAEESHQQQNTGGGNMQILIAILNACGPGMFLEEHIS